MTGRHSPRGSSKAGDHGLARFEISNFARPGFESLVAVAGDRLSLTGRGVLLSNEVFAVFV